MKTSMFGCCNRCLFISILSLCFLFVCGFCIWQLFIIFISVGSGIILTHYSHIAMFVGFQSS